MFYAYVLKSTVDGTFYSGSTENLEKRLREHNQGKMKYTKGKMPWVIVYKETFNTRSESVKRERFLKSGQGRKFINQILGG